MSALHAGNKSVAELVIRVCATADVTPGMWSSYGEAFRNAFHRPIDCGYMRQRFLTTVAGTSYHAFLMSDTDTVVGACSVMPYDYAYRDETERWGLVMGAFIQQDHRSDPFHMKKMYEQLAAFCRAAGVRKVFSLPNATAYRYWKTVTAWRDVGDLRYYVLPLRVGTLLGWKQPWRSIADACGRPLALSWLWIARLASAVWNPVSSGSEVRLLRHPGFSHHRYPTAAGYRTISTDAFAAVYRIVAEDQGAIAYIMECHRSDGLSDARSLATAAACIARHTGVAAVVYIGILPPQISLPKLPRRFAPQRMPLMIGDLSGQDQGALQWLCDVRLWEFGLANYDVR